VPRNHFKIKGKVWRYPGKAGWHFVNVPRRQSGEIKKLFAGMNRGWGSLPVTATIGKTSWNTSIFPDSKLGLYLLPIKAGVRKKEMVVAGDTIAFSIEIEIRVVL
jgi:hypothetical protein